MYRKVLFHMDELERIRNGKLQFPITFEVDPTNKCNNDCSFCMFREFRADHRVDLDYDLYLEALDQMKMLGVRSITFTGGGEPTMNMNFMNMVLAAVHKQFEVGLITNGILLDQVIPYARLFTFIRISLDAASADTNLRIKGVHTFEQVVNKAGAKVVSKKYYPDHHHYSQADMDELAESAGVVGCELAITTMKDWVKIEHDGLSWPGKCNC